MKGSQENEFFPVCTWSVIDREKLHSFQITSNKKVFEIVDMDKEKTISVHNRLKGALAKFYSSDPFAVYIHEQAKFVARKEGVYLKKLRRFVKKQMEQQKL